MTVSVKNKTILAKGLTLLALAVPATIGIAAQAGNAAPLPSIDPTFADAILTFDRASLDRNLAAGGAAPVATNAAAPDARELECMAKVVHHEAANQPRAGQLAVAQLMVNRRQSGRFADTICGVAAQRGQFFDVDRYTPRQDARWAMAVAVSMEALAGTSQPVVPGALFYHASYQKTPGFFRSRQRVASLGGHIFYR